MNGHYIRESGEAQLADALLDYWHRCPAAELPPEPDRETLVRIAPLIKERLKTLSDAAERIPFFFSEDFDYEPGELIQRKMDDAGTLQALNAAAAAVEAVEEFDAASLEARLRGLADDLDIKVGQLLGTLRVATSGLKVSPPLFESLEILGRERVVRDLNRAIGKLEATPD